MCVIIVKHKGVKMPTKATLKQAYICNPHGIGFVSSNNIYWRGMDFEKFYTELQKVRKEDACIIHFRYATHGSHKVENCHPFKMGDIYFAHNGILRIKTENDMTDSETAFIGILHPAATAFGLDSHRFFNIVSGMIGGSKFAFMQNGKIYLFGSWYQEKGVLFSNFNFRPFRYYWR